MSNPTEFVRAMLRRDFQREPTEREVAVWLAAMERNGCFALDTDGR